MKVYWLTLTDHNDTKVYARFVRIHGMERVEEYQMMMKAREMFRDLLASEGRFETYHAKRKAK